MTMPDLYLRPESVFEKSAASEVALPEDPNAWPNEILQELFKQVPYVADFTPNVNMTKVDAERGYALGFIDIMNKTELQPSTSPESLQAAGVQRARVPIIVCNRKLAPFDIILTEKNTMLPLTEERLSQAIFRPQTFDITSRSPGDMSIVGDLYPPYRQNFGFGGGGSTSSMGMGKQGSTTRGVINLAVIDQIRETYKDAPIVERANFEKWAALSVMEMAQAADKAKKVVGGVIPKVIKGKGVMGGLPSASAVAGALPKTAGVEKTALGKLLGELVKKTTDPGRLANVSRLATSRGAQLAAAGGDAAEKGLKYTRVGTFAAQKLQKTGSILQAILPTINDSDFQKFASVVARPEIRALMNENRVGCRAALETLSSFEGGALQKRAAAIPHSIKPDVVQIVTSEDGYAVKVARHDVWEPHTYSVDRGRLVRDFGTKIALAADQNGAVTMVEGGEAPEEKPLETAPITVPGVYTVETVEGEQLEGWVIPNLLELDGTPMPIALFTNGTQMAVQGEIVGAPATSEIPLAEGPPQGHGCFVRHNENGQIEATIPLEITATLNDQGEVLYATQTYDGRPVDVAVQPNIQVITMAPNGHVLIPESFQWMPLQGDAVALLGGTDDAEEGMQQEPGKTAAAYRSVTVRAGDQNNISISGPLIEKVAQKEREFIDIDQAMFLLGGLGVDPHYAATKIAYAVAYHKPIEVKCSRQIKTVAELQGEAKLAALETLGKLPVLRRELFKEAAAIPDPVAVDTVLSLGFINPENMAHFVTYLPVLDDAQSKMCELLLGARLGARDIPVGPLEKAIRSLEEVIRGLKVMAFAQN